MRMSLHAKLLAGISTLVITSGLIIAALATYRYSSALNESATSQGEYLCQSIAMEATDKILINDLMALQKLILHQQSVNPAVAYIFIQREEEILAHTFKGGFPAALIHANQLKNATEWDHRHIRSDTGEGYIDFVWPLLGGRAGSLRLGLSEQYYQTRIVALWAEMAAGCPGRLVRRFCGRRRDRAKDFKTHQSPGPEARTRSMPAIWISRSKPPGTMKSVAWAKPFSRMITRIRDYTGVWKKRPPSWSALTARPKVLLNSCKKSARSRGWKTCAAACSSDFRKTCPAATS